MQATVQLLLGTIAIDTEELSIGEKHLNNCLSVIENYEKQPEIVLITISVYNQNGILWSKREPEKSKVYLEKAEAFYKNIKNDSKDIIDYNELFMKNLESHDKVVALEKFEKNFTLTLYYLAQIYGVLGNALKSSVYCHVTLKRQLEFNDYEPIDWALNTATLSQFFMEKAGFKQARHHLAASTFVLNQYQDELNGVTEVTEEHNAKLETLKHRSADVARCWAKYGLLLLSTSRDRLMNHTDDIDYNCMLPTDLAKLQLEEDSTITSDDLQNLYFPTLDLIEIENQIADKFVLTLNDATKVFLNVKKWLENAASYYTLDTLASDYIEICLDQGQMYESLVFFEDNPENQSKLNKRQADLLETVVKAVNPVYYMQYCRQIWYKLGQIFTEIIDIKSDKMKESKSRPTQSVINKINTLADKGIQYFEKFIDSFKNSSTTTTTTNELPTTTVPQEMETLFLRSYFYIGALNSKYITLDKKTQLENVEKSYAAYKYVADYTKKNTKSGESIVVELSIVNEMIILLPHKILKLKHEVGC